MIELTIYGRGGQGGVTLAKLIATAYFLKGKHVQAFGVYAAERSGAPLQAFVRIDDEEITNHNQIREPDYVIVLDRTLITPHVLTGHKRSGWVILNTPDKPGSCQDVFAGRKVATVDATSLALTHGLGTRAVPIVNTTMLGAIGRVLELGVEEVEAALADLKFVGNNVTSARLAYERVRMKKLTGKVEPGAAAHAPTAVVGLFDAKVGGFPEIKTGSWASQRPERHRLTPPCNHGCPAGNDVSAFIEAVGKDDYDGALEIILRTSPMPGICGRVCPAPCMEACNRRLHDEPVDIRELERYVADHGHRPAPTKPWREQRIAVVGSGPAGLSAAYHLARLGYPITMYEGDDELGGVMRTGIPEYRLPRDILGREIVYILQHGVETRVGKFIQRTDLLNLSHEHAAVFVGTGLQDQRTLNLGDLDDDLVEQGISFLNRVRNGGVRLNGHDVIVVGGGNTAMDAARSALRVGAHSVKVVYRRTRAEMPAIKEEIEEALEEGIVLHELVMPLRVDRDSIGTVMTCQRMRLAEPDESGRPRPVPDTSEDAQFDLRCDRVILALGQSTDVSILPEGSEIHQDGRLVGLSGSPIFAGGDFASSEGTVTAAIGSGRKAALHIHRTLTGEDLFPPEAEPVATPEEIVMHLFTRSPRHRGVTVPALERRRTFTEVRQGYRDSPAYRPAQAEARRCFSCGVCNSCDRCVEFCPEGIVLRDGDGYRFDYGYCKGCGICSTQCPRGIIYMSQL
ncbi:MAG: 2-oxoacid:acceptor oxidoreductase family protein [Phycisphaerae bacterium]